MDILIILLLIAVLSMLLLGLWGLLQYRKLSILLKFMMVCSMVIFSAPAQELPPIVGPGDDEDHPLVLDTPVMVRAGNAVLGVVNQIIGNPGTDQSTWDNNPYSGPGWLLKNISLPANISRNLTTESG